VKQVAKIALIGVYTMRSLARKPENKIMAILIEDIIAQHKKDNVKEADLKEQLPPEYHDLVDVFLGKAANTLPPYRKGVDHYIELEPGKQPDWIPRFYRLTQEEIEEIRRWATENLLREFITASQSL
jgi:hypothetical protein